MTTPPTAYHAVITGDIVSSGRLPQREFKSVQDVLKRAAEEIRAKLGAQVPLPLEVFRGDSWQIMVIDPSLALRVALYLRAYVRAEAPSSSVDTRFAIGVGTIDTPPERSVGEGRGDAFRVSGELLDRKASSRMQFGIANGAGDDAREERSLDVLLHVLDIVVRRWTSAQAHAVRGALLDWKQEKIAETWPGRPITQQAAAQHLARSGWDGVREAVEYYEDVMRTWRPQ
ncbi:MAG: SatD family protein [Candidatus Latescibacteria bacterium]|nr:SatD family protein [Candidatus Latescibacterota bacterium]